MRRLRISLLMGAVPVQLILIAARCGSGSGVTPQPSQAVTPQAPSVVVQPTITPPVAADRQALQGEGVAPQGASGAAGPGTGGQAGSGDAAPASGVGTANAHGCARTLIHPPHNETLQEVHATFTRDLKTGFFAASEQVVRDLAGRFKPLDDVLYDYERRPERAQVQPEEEKVQ